jgi:3-oxoacyl-[acyl-carrier-protein] synthase-3
MPKELIVKAPGMGGRWWQHHLPLTVLTDESYFPYMNSQLCSRNAEWMLVLGNQMD